MSSTASPCTGLCTLDAASGLCLGCGRSLDEIATWGALDDAQRRGIMALLPERISAGGETTLDGSTVDP